MDFFAGQDKARRNTGLLIGLFILAVFLLIALANLAVLLFLGAVSAHGGSSTSSSALGEQLVFDWTLVIAISAAILAVVGLATLVRMVQLSGGGAVIAEGLGGRRVLPDSRNALERRLLNVVAEMAIASGTPVPRVYLLEGETGINAFAAGFSTSDAVIGVTRGAMEQLTRDELQGVIGHEFSHILNGDMRLNLRLIAILHGILFLAYIGRFLLRSLRGTRSRSSKGGNAVFALAMLGLAFVVIGSGGSFCGNLIKAAVSRQREYLADSSAVQFTRNPSGLANALKRIGSTLTQGVLGHSKAAEASHLFFADALTHRFSAAFATHPPLADRIRRLDPQWRGEFSVPRVTLAESVLSEPASVAAASVSGLSGADVPVDAARAPQEVSVSSSSVLVAGIPLHLQEAATNELSAPAMVCALLLDDEAVQRRRQLDALEDRGVCRGAEAEYLWEELQYLDSVGRLAVLNLCAPVLTAMTPTRRAELWRHCEILFAGLEQPEVPQWALYRQAGLLLKPVRNAAPKFRRLSSMRGALEVVLSALAHSGGMEKNQSARALGLANDRLGLNGLRFLSNAHQQREQLDRALAKMALAYPLLKPRILKACSVVIQADNRITADEKLMLQLIATAIDCPAPALLEMSDD